MDTQAGKDLSEWNELLKGSARINEMKRQIHQTLTWLEGMIDVSNLPKWTVILEVELDNGMVVELRKPKYSISFDLLSHDRKIITSGIQQSAESLRIVELAYVYNALPKITRMVADHFPAVRMRVDMICSFADL